MYTAKDLEEWSENHDSFRHEQNLVQWTEKKQPYVEALFIVVVTNGVGKDFVINNGACSCSTVILEDGISLMEVGGLLQEWDDREEPAGQQDSMPWRTASHPRIWGACWSPSKWRGPNIH